MELGSTFFGRNDIRGLIEFLSNAESIAALNCVALKSVGALNGITSTVTPSLA